MSPLPRALAAPWVLAALLLAAPLAAQVPPVVQDTLPPDTLPAQPPDTAAADTLRPAVLFPAMPVPAAIAPAVDEWVWDRSALLREGATSLTDLLARIPGVTPLRAGLHLQPEAVAVLGMTAGRMEIEVDGFVLDPLAAATFDLAQLPLAQIRELRVERRLGLLRIRIFSEAPEGPQPLSRVEAGTGVPPANLFRGLFLAPHVIAGPLGLAIQWFETEGFGRARPANMFSAWGKWAWTDGGRGVQLELWQSTLERLPNSPWPGERRRQDLVVRARNTFAPGLVGEVYGGRSTLRESPRMAAGDTAVVVTDRDSYQLGARAAWAAGATGVTAAVRYRTAEFLPSVEGILTAEAALGPLQAGAEAGYAAWRRHDGAPYLTLRGQVAVLPGAGAFAEFTAGRRAAPAPGEDEGAGAPFAGAAGLTERTAWRGGINAALGTRASGTVAGIGFRQHISPTFGLPFDTAAPGLGAGSVRGVEAAGRLVLLPRFFTLTGSVTALTGTETWLYLPERTWRTALELHTFPLRSENLEIFGRLEAVQRGRMNAWSRVPAGPETPASMALVTLPGHTRVHAYLHIRIIDVRAFIRYDDLTAREGIEELPGILHTRPRIFYGVRWNLWN